MWIKRLRVENWLSFRGVHELVLEPRAYAIHAVFDSDPRRSNFGGKSALGESILFALTGWLNPGRLFDNSDSWITHGEKEGLVFLEFDDGSSVSRLKRVGKSQQLVYTEASGATAKQDEAQRALDARVGLSESDLLMTAMVAQRESGFIARSRGADLDEVFGEWLRLGKLDKATARLEKSASAEAAALASLETRSASCRESTFAETNGVDLASELGAKRAALDEARTTHAGLLERLRIARAMEAELAKTRQLDRLQEEGVVLRARYDAMDLGGRKAELAEAAEYATQARLAHGKASHEFNNLTRLAAGEFGGECPVAHMTCPVADQVTKDKVRLKALARGFGEETIACSRQRDVAEAKAAALSARVQEAERLAERLQTMREQVERIAETIDPEAPEPEDVPPLIEEIHAAERALQTAAEEHSICESRIARAAQVEKTSRELAPQIHKARRRSDVLAVAAAVLRRVRREILKAALLEIQDGANDDLAQMGADLVVDLRWEREGRDLSKACEECGRGFPASTKVRRCECGAERGPQMIRRLDCRLSNRSVGAEDLAGLALQLAAARWLRAERSSGWEVGLLDEVGSALDVAHRRMLSRALPGMLSRAGFVQSFVISHDAASESALPGRIVVRSDGKYSRVEVVT